MNALLPSAIVLYRWRLRPGSEARFAAVWSTITKTLRDERGSLGSRLHQGDDGIWYGYAQWPDAEAITRALAQPVDNAAAARMREAVIEDAVIENFVPVRLAPVADYLVPPR